jgi:hypothetical protein
MGKDILRTKKKKGKRGKKKMGVADITKNDDV